MKHKLKRIDSFDITFADSSARNELKINEKRVHVDGTSARKGEGEKRFYIGRDEKYYDQFFDFANDPEFFFLKQDLIDYFHDVENELKNPQYQYGNDNAAIKLILNDYKIKLEQLDRSRVFLSFKNTSNGIMNTHSKSWRAKHSQSDLPRK